MDQQHSQASGGSPQGASAGGGQPHQQPHIKNGHAPSPAHFPNPNEAGSSSLELGLGLVDASAQQYTGSPPDFAAYNTNATSFFGNQQPPPQPYAQQPNLAEPPVSFELNQSFTDQLKSEEPSFGAQNQANNFPQNGLLAPSNFGATDFTIFPPTPGESQFGAPLFVADGRDASMMAQANHSPTPPHLLNPDGHQPGSANHSPAFNQHQFSPPPGRHSRNVSLGPEAALLPRQIDWSQSQFQSHRRTPSEYSDVSSAAPSPNLLSQESFDSIDQSHSPMQRPQDAALFQELHGIGSFSISDHGTHTPAHRSPSHSPAISPRILPQQLPDVGQQAAYLNNGFGQPAPYLQAPQEAFPQLPQDAPETQAGQMPAPPSINIDFAPTSVRSGFEQPKSLDVDSLTPPERGMSSLIKMQNGV